MSSKIKVQFFMDLVPGAWKLVGHRTELKLPFEIYYWDNSQYIYEGRDYDVHVVNRSSIHPPIKKVLKMVGEYIDKHINKGKL